MKRIPFLVALGAALLCTGAVAFAAEANPEPAAEKKPAACCCEKKMETCCADGKNCCAEAQADGKTDGNACCGEAACCEGEKPTCKGGAAC